MGRSGSWWCGVVLVLGCSGSTETSLDVTGSWCGREVDTAVECVGDEVEYLELVQTGPQVTGRICEAYDKDCAPVENGRVEGSRLRFDVSPKVVGGRADLELSGERLSGALHSDKCACELPFTFHRL